MPQNLGQVAAIITSQTAPSNTSVLWGKEDAGGNVLGYYRYDQGQSAWIEITVVHRGSTPPQNEDIVWLDENFAAPMPKTYNTGTGEWEFIFQLSRRTENANIQLRDTDNNQVIDFTHNSAGAIIELPDIPVDDFQCIIARLGEGEVYINTDGTTINGASGSFILKHQYSQVVIRRYAPAAYIISGNLITG